MNSESNQPNSSKGGKEKTHTSGESQENPTELEHSTSHSEKESGQEGGKQTNAIRHGGSRSHLFHSFHMHKDMIIAIVVTFILAGLLGFYGGRYYEQQTRRKFMQQRIQNMQGQNGAGQNGLRQFNRDGFPRGGMMRQ